MLLPCRYMSTCILFILCRLLPMLAVLAPVPPVSVLQPEAPPLKATLTSMMSNFREWMPSALTTHTHRKMVLVHNYYTLSMTLA